MPCYLWLSWFKNSCKIILIVRKEDNGIKRYLHLGTGNYNDSTAKLYTDIGLMTANDEFGSDASAFFNLLSGYSEPLYGINWLWPFRFARRRFTFDR